MYYVNMYVCVTLWMYACQYVRMCCIMYVCMALCMYACHYGCMYVNMYVCMSIYYAVHLTYCLQLLQLPLHGDAPVLININ